MTSTIRDHDAAAGGSEAQRGLGEAGGEMILKTDTRVRVRVPAGKREEILAAYDRSGMSGAAFARSVGVKYSTFANWVRKRRGNGEREACGNGDRAISSSEQPASQTTTPRRRRRRRPGTGTETKPRARAKVPAPVALWEAVLEEPGVARSSSAPVSGAESTRTSGGVEIEMAAGVRLRVSSRADVPLAVELVKALSLSQDQPTSQTQPHGGGSC